MGKKTQVLILFLNTCAFYIPRSCLFFLLCFLFNDCCFRFFNLCDRCFAHRDTAVFVVSELYDDIVICDIDDYAVETACRYDCISDCKVLNFLFRF